MTLAGKAKQKWTTQHKNATLIGSSTKTPTQKILQIYLEIEI